VEQTKRQTPSKVPTVPGQHTHTHTHTHPNPPTPTHPQIYRQDAGNILCIQCTLTLEPVHECTPRSHFYIFLNFFNFFILFYTGRTRAIRAHCLVPYNSTYLHTNSSSSFVHCPLTNPPLRFPTLSLSDGAAAAPAVFWSAGGKQSGK
jgi:hypothetical protein